MFQKVIKKRIYAPPINYNRKDMQEPMHPLTEEWVKKMWYICNGILAIKRMGLCHLQLHGGTWRLS